MHQSPSYYPLHLSSDHINFDILKKFQHLTPSPRQLQLGYCRNLSARHWIKLIHEFQHIEKLIFSMESQDILHTEIAHFVPSEESRGPSLGILDSRAEPYSTSVLRYLLNHMDTPLSLHTLTLVIFRWSHQPRWFVRNTSPMLIL